VLYDTKADPDSWRDCVVPDKTLWLVRRPCGYWRDPVVPDRILVPNGTLWLVRRPCDYWGDPVVPDRILGTSRSAFPPRKKWIENRLEMIIPNYIKHTEIYQLVCSGIPKNFNYDRRLIKHVPIRMSVIFERWIVFVKNKLEVNRTIKKSSFWKTDLVWNCIY